MKVGDRVIELKYHEYRGCAGAIYKKPISGKIGTITKIKDLGDGDIGYRVKFEDGREYYAGYKTDIIPVAIE